MAFALGRNMGQMGQPRMPSGEMSPARSPVNSGGQGYTRGWGCCGCKKGEAQTEFRTPTLQRSAYRLAGEESPRDDDEFRELPGFHEAADIYKRRSRKQSTAEAFSQIAEQFCCKQCPKCNQMCEKQDEDSCDHMTCYCGHEFCWSCLADRDVILQHGNHYHKPTCRFYFAYNGAAQFKPNCPVCKTTGKACQPPRK